MLEAAVEGSGGHVGILGVTVLTSISEEDIKSAGFKKEFSRDVSKLVLKRAAVAQASGCSGIVCSGQEVKMVKEIFGNNFIAVTPGIRPGWETKEDDQRRIVTPQKAIEEGADYLVIGRPIRNAEDPVSAASRIADEIGLSLNNQTD
jgi:orotidine-5'-phosphate decarboxylase